MIFYLSGKVTGLSLEEASERFAKAEAIMQQFGHTIINPLKLEHKPDAKWVDYMAADIEALLGCDGIYMLDGWGESRGARIEYAIAREMGLKIFFETDNAPLSKLECKKS